jgi:hypothetical protein
MGATAQATKRRRPQPMSIDELSWHDGVLLEWSFTPGRNVRGSIELRFALYPEQIKSPTRNAVVVRCEGVRRFFVSCDVAELREYASAGHVVDGYRKGRVLRVSLTGGLIEVDATSFKVAQSGSRRE